MLWQPDLAIPELIFDPEGIHRAVLNVVTNSIDAVSERPTPGRVTVATQYSVPEGMVRIIVEDNGPGIPADQMEHLFSPFVSSKKSRGTGLGLPVSQKILVEHGGRILVASEPGQGCRFTLELPATLPTTKLETVPMTERGRGEREPRKKPKSNELWWSKGRNCLAGRLARRAAGGCSAVHEHGGPARPLHYRTLEVSSG